MGKEKSYEEVIQKILCIKRSTYYNYKKEKRPIIKFLKLFSPYTLKAFVQETECQENTFKYENNTFIHYRSFVNELSRNDLHNFATSLKKTKNYGAFIKKIRDASPSLFLKIQNLSSLYNFKRIFLYKEDLLLYIQYTLNAHNSIINTISYEINNFIQNAFMRLDFEKFENQNEIIKFIFDEIQLMNFFDRLSKEAKYEERHIFTNNNLIEKIEE